MRRVLLISFICLSKLAGYTQADTTFWFAAPYVSSDYNYDRPILLRISTYQLPCNVSVSQPANGGLPPQVMMIPANTTQTVDLTNWITNIECAPGNVIQNRGIEISSDNNIAVYYEVNANGPNPELYSLKGRNSLGNQFYISSQYFLDNTPTYTPLPFSSFNIVATQDNSVVTIMPAKNIIGHLANIPFNITLNKGQTYAAIATSQAAIQHLQGSYVTSTKPIAITLSDDLLYGSQYGGVCSDLAGDQTVPVNIVGSQYIAFKSKLNYPYDKVYITATQNATSVTQDGVLITSLNAGQSVELTISGDVTYIQTSAPAYAYQLAGYGCEVGSAILPKINCTGSSSVSVARSTNESFIITLLIKNGSQNNFLINGVSGVITGTQFNVVPGTGGVYYYAKVNLPLLNYPNGSVIKISNTSDVFQCGVLEGDISGVAFGYFSDFNTINTNIFSSNTKPCAGSDVHLTTGNVASATYSWSGPNNFSSNIQNPTINNISILNTGKYILTVTDPSCGVFKDSVDIVVNPKSFSTINKSICEGQAYLGYDSTGTYVDTLISANGCDSIRTINLIVNSRKTAYVNSTICQGQTYLGHNNSGIYIDTLVAVNGCDSILTINLTVMSISFSTFNQTICEGQSFMGYTQNGTYIDTLMAINGCDSIRTVNLLIVNKPHPNLGQDTSICNGDKILLSPGNFSSYLWQDGSTQDSLIVTEPGLYSVIVTNLCGSSTDEINIIENSCEIYFPNAFTPNNDGKNETFHILNANGLQDYYLAIYNRWGKNVFETLDYKKGWDGNVKNVPADVGVYVWYCRFKKANISKFMKGTVTLVR
jgi:gliding motility-associated-like protein